MLNEVMKQGASKRSDSYRDRSMARELIDDEEKDDNDEKFKAKMQ